MLKVIWDGVTQFGGYLILGCWAGGSLTSHRPRLTNWADRSRRGKQQELRSGGAPLPTSGRPPGQVMSGVKFKRVQAAAAADVIFWIPQPGWCRETHRTSGVNYRVNWLKWDRHIFSGHQSGVISVIVRWDYSNLISRKSVRKSNTTIFVFDHIGCFLTKLQISYMESGQHHLIHPHPWMTEWCRNDKNGPFLDHSQRNDAEMMCFHLSHSSIISSFGGHSNVEWPSNDKKVSPPSFL